MLSTMIIFPVGLNTLITKAYGDVKPKLWLMVRIPATTLVEVKLPLIAEPLVTPAQELACKAHVSAVAALIEACIALAEACAAEASPVLG